MPESRATQDMWPLVATLALMASVGKPSRDRVTAVVIAGRSVRHRLFSLCIWTGHQREIMSVTSKIFQLAHWVQSCPPREARFSEARSVFCLISFWSKKLLSHQVLVCSLIRCWFLQADLSHLLLESHTRTEKKDLLLL
jgi:hypothetical protein